MIKLLCIDCKKEISLGSLRCKPCSRKGKLNSNYKLGKCSDNPNHCLDCGKEIDYISIRCRKCAKQGKLHPLFGIKRPEWSERMKNNKFSFIHGNGYAPYSIEFTQKLKDQIRKRDNYECQGCYCSMTEEEHLSIYNRTLEIHHIDYNKENCEENNLITLCKQCNIRVNWNRDYYQKYFINKIEIKNICQTIKFHN